MDGNIKHLFQASHFTKAEIDEVIANNVVNPDAKQYVLEHLVP